jgi:adenylate cyclase
VDAAREIEQTLRIARDEVEARIARYRIGAFAAAVVITLVLHAILLGRGEPPTFLPTFAFAGVVVYATILRALVVRLGARAWLVHLSIALDLVAAAAPFIAVHLFAPDDVRAAVPRFAPPVIAGGMALVVMLNGLRGDVVASISGAAMASVILLATTIPLVGFRPELVALAAILWIMGGISVASAKQGRRTLETFARLQLLRRYLSPAAVERVMRDDPGAALSLGGSLVTVTILAADLRGFTAMSEALPPTEVVRQLNEFHGTMLEAIDGHEGVLDKFIGDGILAVFGLERATTSADPSQGASSALACALAMLRRLESLNAVRAARGEATLRMGIGVHTGPVIAGNIGAPGRRLEFTVIGDTVNTASRLESLTKEAGTSLLVSTDTTSRLSKTLAVSLRPLPAMSMRGKKDAIQVFTSV